MIVLTSTDGATASIHPQGAHITQWKSAGGAEPLFLSERAVFKEGTPIRGGVPVIFPQFAGEGPLLKHGFARTALWEFQSLHSNHEGAEATFTLNDSPATRAHWPQAFLATLKVRIGGDSLCVQLEVLNRGDQPFQFTAALHTYVAVADIRAVTVEGLAGLHYRDTADGGAMKQETADALAIHGEVDRNYFDTPPDLTLHDGPRRLELHQQGFCDTVVWNPGAERSLGFADLAADDYQRFLCIEAAVIGRPVVLAPGAGWQGWQSLRAP
ncbi:MAG: D-hexose-6-phosphate mutarotase [Stagnimonas sp.]|nr:D-hexose-6-phosphate mutarotase [Stagnimonas sp.]